MSQIYSKEYTHQAINDLKTKLLAEQISTNEDDLALYGKDWTNFFKPCPLAVVFPNSIEDTQIIVHWASQYNMPLVPSGGRTGLSGGALACKGEVVVNFSRMNKIIEFNKYDSTITAQAGAVTEDLQNFAKEHNTYFPLDFASRGSSQIGGNVATNAGGIKVVKYGLIRNWILGLKVITGTGDILNLRRGLVKDSSGFDLSQLFIGSEGSLGFIVEVTIKVAQMEKETSVMILGMKNLTCITELLHCFRSKLSIIAFEVFSEKALHYVMKQKQREHPFANSSIYSPFYALVEYEDYITNKSEDAAMSVFEYGMEQSWILDGIISQSQSQAKTFWSFREDISESISHMTPYKNDLSVRISLIPQFVLEVDTILSENYPDFEIIWFGHIGDGNLHINILKPNSWLAEDFLKECRRVDQILFPIVKKFGGSISAEHGIGLIKKPFLNFSKSDVEISIMKDIKNIFDPKGILNPGKIFDLQM